ncbi:MAG: quinol:cytochrome C oxidoreductase [Catalinimonas sp.]
MATHHHEPVNLDERYAFTQATKKGLFITMGVGALLLIAGVVLAAFFGGGDHGEAAAHGDEAHTAAASAYADGEQHEAGEVATAEDGAFEREPATAGVYGEEAHADEAHGEAHAEAGGHHAVPWYARIWANLWLNAVYFMGISFIGVFFYAIQYVTQAGWSASLQRVMSSMGAWIPFAGGALLLTFLFGSHSLFEWTHGYLYEEGTATYDPILAGKRAYLNTPFFLIRLVLFVGLWYFFYLRLRKLSQDEDLNGGTHFYKKSIGMSAIFIIIFAVSESMISWDWTMSIQPHWYSTLWGWYNFASWFVAGLCTMTLATILLKEQGYLKVINENHLHDLGKFIFGFSIFWTYLWFSQFLLIYYANIPEEATFFIDRMRGFDGHYSMAFFLNLIINFAFPFLVLMPRDAKRQGIILKVVCCVLLVGHWLDFYLMIMPGVLRGNDGFGLLEFGTVALFAGGFVFVFANALSKINLLPRNHPMVEESIHHEVV